MVLIFCSKCDSLSINAGTRRDIVISQPMSRPAFVWQKETLWWSDNAGMFRTNGPPTWWLVCRALLPFALEQGDVAFRARMRRGAQPSKTGNVRCIALYSTLWWRVWYLEANVTFALQTAFKDCEVQCSASHPCWHQHRQEGFLRVLRSLATSRACLKQQTICDALLCNVVAAGVQPTICVALPGSPVQF